MGPVERQVRPHLRGGLDAPAGDAGVAGEAAVAGDAADAGAAATVLVVVSLPIQDAVNSFRLFASPQRSIKSRDPRKASRFGFEYCRDIWQVVSAKCLRSHTAWRFEKSNWVNARLVIRGASAVNAKLLVFSHTGGTVSPSAATRAAPIAARPETTKRSTLNKMSYVRFTKAYLSESAISVVSNFPISTRSFAAKAVDFSSAKAGLTSNVAQRNATMSKRNDFIFPPSCKSGSV